MVRVRSVFFRGAGAEETCVQQMSHRRRHVCLHCHERERRTSPSVSTVHTEVVQPAPDGHMCGLIKDLSYLGYVAANCID